MKNIQVIDPANNCTYSIYSISDEEFSIIFPDGADIEFIEDLVKRLPAGADVEFCSNLWRNPVEKKCVNGIHGTLFYQLADRKREYYPNKRFYDNARGFHANERKAFGISDSSKISSDGTSNSFLGGHMKNIQVIDPANNCTYSIYSISDEEFSIIFPDGADIEFVEDLKIRLPTQIFDEFHSKLWRSPVERVNVKGIHGTLFYRLAEKKRRYYPNKRFYDNVYGFSADQRKAFGISESR
jgi:hypothetical protein